MTDETRQLKDWFAERRHEQIVNDLETGGLIAFGVPILSRYSEADEIIRMIQFCRDCARMRVAHYVSDVFYNSKAGIPSIAISDVVQEGDVVEVRLLAAAKKHFSSFFWPRGEEYRNGADFEAWIEAQHGVSPSPELLDQLYPDAIPIRAE